ncbi:MAG: DUF6886 family protein [Dehalococcoidia bacterium]
MRLFHFSEDPHIERFVPRSPEKRPEVEPMVWAVAEEFAWTYLFPRDCPRVLLWGTTDTTATDAARWLGGDPAARIAYIEWAWLERMHATALHRYEFDPARFRPLVDDEWMLVSRQVETPVAVGPVGDLVEALRASCVELRLMPTLAPLYGAWESTIHFSGIRLRNAVGWPETAPSPPPRVS